MLVRSPKTEHHVSGESRLVPLFPELRPFLNESFLQAESGTEFFENLSFGLTCSGQSSSRLVNGGEWQ
jgi:hypothetical protein